MGLGYPTMRTGGKSEGKEWEGFPALVG